MADALDGFRTKITTLTILDGGTGGVGAGVIDISLAATLVAVVSLAETIYFHVRTAIINQKNMDKTVEEILKTKQGRIRQAPLPPGGPDWKDILKKTLRDKGISEKEC